MAIRPCCALVLFTVLSNCVPDEPGIPRGLQNHLPPSFQLSIDNRWATFAEVSISLTPSAYQPGIVEAGLAWGEQAMPTPDNTSLFQAWTVPVLRDTFSQTLPNLSPATTYHIRAFVRDALGELFFSEEAVFNTRPYWSALPDFPDGPRSKLIAFVIGAKAYFGTGGTGSGGNDFWSYDPGTGAVSQLADYTGGAFTFGGVGFSVKGKGYIGFGFNNGNKFFAYDPLTDTWSPKATYPGGAFMEAAAFAVGDTGYVCAGNTFYAYDPVSNTFSTRAAFPGGSRTGAVGMVIGRKAYLGFGSSGSLKKDWYRYDPDADEWKKMNDFPGAARMDAVAFVLQGKGYLGTGEPNLNDWWEYDPEGDTFLPAPSFSGGGASSCAGFALGDRGYLLCGYRAGQVASDEFWEFSPR